jgi:hypothetical protein
MMSQLTLAAAVVAGVLVVAVGAALAPPLPAGHGATDAPDAGLVGVAVVVPVEAAVGVAVPAVVGDALPAPAVGDAVPPPPWWWPAAAAGFTNAAGEAQLSAELLTCVVKPSVKAMAPPTTTASATGMAMVTAVRRLAWLLCRRRYADRCLFGMQSTSMSLGGCCSSSYGVLFLRGLESRR